MDSEKESRFGDLGYVRKSDNEIEIRCYDRKTGEEKSRVIARTVKPGSYEKAYLEPQIKKPNLIKRVRDFFNRY
ncbi:MAG: hypothetical protein PVJ67_06775 [Candidatus Pacearchaeota archaeon]